MDVLKDFSADNFSRPAFTHQNSFQQTLEIEPSSTMKGGGEGSGKDGCPFLGRDVLFQAAIAFYCTTLRSFQRP